MQIKAALLPNKELLPNKKDKRETSSKTKAATWPYKNWFVSLGFYLYKCNSS